MSDICKVQGSVTIAPAGSSTSGDPEIAAILNTQLSLEKKAVQIVSLAADPAESVAFGDITEACVVLMTASAKVKARITSADGSTQAVPFDKLLLLVSKEVPITAIDLTRVSGQATTVRVTLGESP